MVVHLFAQCWNDEWMLPFFFRHYDGLVDRYVIYDDGSTDNSWAILQSHPRVEARRFVRAVPDSFALSEQALSNDCWKASSGEADWVIVTDLDEHLFHPAWRAYLSRCAHDGVTAIPALGFQMVCDTVPTSGEHLAAAHPVGAPWVQMMKLSIFDPVAIKEINFTPGRHRADPQGRVRVPATDEMLLLHYKYMGFERTHLRHQQLRQGLGRVDAARGWGHKYSWSADELRDDWDRCAGRAVDIRALGSEPAARYPSTPWWQKYRELSPSGGGNMS
jgi:glycosyltransferase involved in cell wall biosynthesis